MTYGYWRPVCAAKLPACDGFLISSKAIYKSNIDKDWNTFLNQLIAELQSREPSLKQICDWKLYSEEDKLFVVLKNESVDIIVEDVPGFVAVYVIVPKECKIKRTAKKQHPRYTEILKMSLSKFYKGNIYKRIDTRNIELAG